MIRLMAVASARNLHEAQLACTMHAHENLHCEHPLQQPCPRMPRRAHFLALFLAKKLALHGFARTVFATLAPSRDQAPLPRSAAFEASTPA